MTPDPRAQELAEKLYSLYSLDSSTTGSVSLPGAAERITAAFATVRREALEEAAKIALDGCLVPPDGGSPTREEVAVCDNIAYAIRALIPNPPAEAPPEIAPFMQLVDPDAPAEPASNYEPMCCMTPELYDAAAAAARLFAEMWGAQEEHALNSVTLAYMMERHGLTKRRAQWLDGNPPYDPTELGSAVLRLAKGE